MCMLLFLSPPHHLSANLLTHPRSTLLRLFYHLTTPGIGPVSVAHNQPEHPAAHHLYCVHDLFKAICTGAVPPAARRRCNPWRCSSPLGITRNFSSGGPIFQQLAYNIHRAPFKMILQVTP
ncbi:hypothetical protein DFH09DRAFT_1322840 [Mycena vulgaris]|nr:hypothetical protein DFH09DRAFT_1322840 [Mycena vulgaris]